MEWPSKNISPGGILHPAKATYSPETQQFLKEYKRKAENDLNEVKNQLKLVLQILRERRPQTVTEHSENDYEDYDSSLPIKTDEDVAVWENDLSKKEEQKKNVLMEESKLTMMQRKNLNYILRNGEPLPPLAKTGRRTKSIIPEVTIRPGSSKRRSRETIISSGAYQRDSVMPFQPFVDREREKEKLANKMAYNKIIDITKEKVIRKVEKEEPKPEPNRFDQLVAEIKEREEWIKEMEQLGQAEKYRLIIEQQIQNKVREMEKLKGSNKK